MVRALFFISFFLTNLNDSQDSRGRGKPSFSFLSTTTTCSTDTYTLAGRLLQRAQLWNDKEVCKSDLNVLFVLYFDSSSFFKVGSATVNNIL